MITNATMIQYFNEGNMEKLKEALEKNVREEAVKVTGRKTNKLKLAEKFFKGIDDYRPNLKGSAVDKDGNYVFCDGFRMIWSKEDFGLPVIPKERAFNVDSFFESLERNYRNKPHYEVKVSDILEDLTVHTKTHKKTERAPFTIKYNDDFILINGHWLLDAIKFSEAETLDIISDRAPVVLRGKDGYNALVLPIRE